jgi:hypothetical protein
MQRKLVWIGMVAVIILGTGLRLWRISELPYALDMDEAALGYDAYTIGNWGTDEYGKRIPAYFSSLGDYKYSTYVYMSVPWVKVFGLNEWSTRSTSAMAGMISLVLAGILTTLAFKKPGLSLAVMVMWAISPWEFYVSRGAYEANLGLMLSLLFFTCLAYWRIKKYPFFAWAAIIFFGLGIYSYSATRLFLCVAVLFLSGFFAIGKQKAAALLCSLLCIAGAVSFISPEGRMRAGEVSLFVHGAENSNKEIALAIHEDGIAKPKTALPITRFFHNKPLSMAVSFTHQYIFHFSPEFLFISGDTRHKYSIEGVGLLMLIEAILILTGIIAITHLKNKFAWVPFIWLLVGTVPSAATVEPAHALRFLIASPAFVLFSGIGLFTWFKLPLGKLPARILKGGLTLILILNSAYVMHQYFIHKPYHQPWYTDGGTKEMVKAVTALAPQYKQVAISRDQYIFFLFYNGVPVNEFLSEAKILPMSAFNQWERVETYKNIVFKMPMDCPKIGKLHVLYVCRGLEVPQNAKVVSSIRFLDNIPAFNLIEFVPISSKDIGVLPERLSRMAETDLRFNKEGLLPEDYPTPWF